MHGATFNQMNGIYEAHTIQAEAAAGAPVTDGHGHAGHFPNFTADTVSQIGKDSPETAAGAAIADRKQFIAGTNAQPDGIKFVASDQMRQPRLPAPMDMLSGFLLCDAASQFRMDSEGRFPQKQASQIMRIVLAVRRLPTNAFIHHPVVTGFFDEVIHDGRRQHRSTGQRNVLIYSNGPVLGQIDDVIALKEQMIHHASKNRQLTEPGIEEPLRKSFFEQSNKPQRSCHDFSPVGLLNPVFCFLYKAGT
jgi:hypothetical protein